MSFSIAIVIPSLQTGGGVTTVARFLYGVLQGQPGYDPNYVSIATQRDDSASLRLLKPDTWVSGIQVETGTDEGNPYRHVGAFLTEFEFQRYRPRPKLTRILNEHDLIQVVAGHPAWALVAGNTDSPVSLQVATLANVERAMKRQEGGGLIGTWRSLMTRVATWLGDRALRQVDAVFVENDWMYEHVQEIAPSTEAVFAPPGVDADTFVPSSTPFTERDYILSVGRFGDPRKNVSLLFKAYARIREALGDEAPPLVLAGRTGPSGDAWKVAERCDVRQHVTFLEDVSHERLVELYQEAQLFLLSSDEEGLGLVILEAMACGIPVVSTDCGGPSTVVQEGETGRLVPKRDPDKLASEAVDLLRDPSLLQKYGQNARERIVQKFSEEATMNEFLDVYEDLLDAPHS
ncbi:glycosyltransferase involved in cell wall biosynthesis [Salinibacter ruber]|uniref:glycosyltransferase family 4 protein n=1 Tax=Salinibacter ruber TaxID=146919 RepID=UPI0020741871|nr:glycosyltransferase [Salinibacter ruber]MCS4044981.1 glycosyltransferase involved in cell wall biosynthesis [Salinibacter ruber]